jgi:hypothetical protein
MKFATVFKSFRGWSWLLGGLSLVPILFLGYQYWQFLAWASKRSNNGEFVCGTGIVAVLFLCAAVAFLLALCAVVCGFIAYIKTPKPRPLKRTLELPLVGVVLVLAFLGYLAVAYFNWSI